MTSPRHSWDHDDVIRIAATEADSGCSETHRRCVACGLIKITMHPPQGICWLEFTMPRSSARIVLSTTPPCRQAEVVEIAAAPAEVPFS